MTQSDRPLEGRTALITGASRGIGAAVARRFAAEGAHVVLTARTVAGLEEVDDEIRQTNGDDHSATLVPLDLGDFEELDKLGPALARRFGKLDILVANAAILGDLTPIAQIEPEAWDEIVKINLTANWRLLRTLEPLLRASDAGRAIFMTSGVSGGRAFWGGYAVTKTAVEALARTWAEELAQTPVRINTIDPGAVRTNMRADAYPGEDPETLPAPDDITDRFVELASPEFDRTGQVFHVR